MKEFKKEFDRYREAINNDIEQVELVISWLEQFRANFEDAEIEKVISFLKGTYLVQNLKKLKHKNSHGILRIDVWS